jgi:undecaprenyl pyrophosphate phosphatase UppP
VGFVVAAVSGYFAISLLLTVIKKVGLLPFAAYCFLVGTITILVF